MISSKMEWMRCVSASGVTTQFYFWVESQYVTLFALVPQGEPGNDSGL